MSHLSVRPGLRVLCLLGAMLGSWVCGEASAVDVDSGAAAAAGSVDFDGTVGSGGPHSVGSPMGSQYTYEVNSSEGAVAGTNLFHSFSVFNVANEETLAFVGPGQFSNVFARVDGPIQIHGDVTSEHAGANLFLLSRFGITVGETGRFVDLPAGLTLSTADQVVFGSGVFPTDGAPWSPAGCCEGAPQALVFEERAPEESVSQILLGTDVAGGSLGDFNAFTAVAGRIGLTKRSIVVPGTVLRLAATGRSAVEVSLLRGADIPDWVAGLGAEAEVEILASRVEARIPLVSTGGRIILEGGVIRVSGGESFLRAGGNAEGPAIQTAGGVSIEMDSVLLQRPEDLGAGLVSGPGIELSAPLIHLLGKSGGGGVVSIQSYGAPILMKGEQVLLSGESNAQVFGLSTEGLEPLPSGLAVGIHVEGSDEVRLEDGSALVSNPENATGQGLDQGPGIRVQGGGLSLLNGGQIRTPFVWDRPGGDIYVDVLGDVLISGVRPVWVDGKDKFEQSGLLARPFEGDLIEAWAPGGRIDVRAGSLTMRNGGLISTSTQGKAASAGSIDIRVDGLLSVSGTGEGGVHSEIVARVSDGLPGSISLRGGDIEFFDKGFATVSSRGSAFAGELRVIADRSLRLESGGALNAEGLQGSPAAGRIVVGAGQRIDIIDGGKIETNSNSGEGRGGDIEIGVVLKPRYLVLNRGELKTSAAKGDGGNIDIAADYFLESTDSVINPSSFDGGVDGVVTVNAPEVQVAGRVEPLPVSYLDVSALLRAQCAARRDAGQSSFTIEGRPGTPPAWDGYRPSVIAPGDPEPEAVSPGGGSVRRQLDGFDVGCGSGWRLAVRD